MPPGRHRIRLVGAEAEPSWLGAVLDAYAVVDADVERVVALRVRGGESLACVAGCFQCCIQPVPLTKYEIMAIGWYLAHGAVPGALDAVAAARHRRGGSWACPMLQDGGCVAYPVRPIACRRFNVLGRPCLVGEITEATRPGDMLAPGEGALRRAMALLLPLAGVAPKDMRRALDERLLHNEAVLIQGVDWEAVVQGVTQGRQGVDGGLREKIHAG